jgi:hypothetical protein
LLFLDYREFLLFEITLDNIIFDFRYLNFNWFRRLLFWEGLSLRLGDLIIEFYVIWIINSDQIMQFLIIFMYCPYLESTSQDKVVKIFDLIIFFVWTF